MTISKQLISVSVLLLSVAACSGTGEGPDGSTATGGSGTQAGTGGSGAGTSTGGNNGALPSGGASGAGTGGTGTGGTTGSGGASGGSGGADVGSGGDGAGSGGAAAGGSESGGTGGEQSDCNGYVGITYDDGPVNTDAFVNALEQAGLVPVTFFVNGSQIASHQGAIAKMLTVGDVQSHAYTHAHLAEAGKTPASEAEVKKQLDDNNAAIVGAGAPQPTIFRPPYGETSSNISAAAAELGMIVITWDVDSADWNGASTSAIVSANERLTDGQVILMHENQNASLAAIPQIAAALEAKGMCPGRLDPNTGKAVAP